MITPLQVLVVADQARTRKGLRALLETCPLAGEVREAMSAKEALALIEAAAPDAVVLDMYLQEQSGLDIAQAIKKGWPSIRVLTLSWYTEGASDALTAGADVVISKGESPAVLLDALCRGAAGANDP